MTAEDWTSGDASTMTVFLNGSRIPERDALGEPILDDSFLLLFNPLGDGASMTLPDRSYGRTWETVVDTADPLLAARKRVWRAGGRIDLQAHTMMVMRCRY
jgi:glycogen operon protein